MRMFVLVVVLGGLPLPALWAQRDTVLAHRWVGTHGGRPLHFEFYGDTMLVVNDRHVLDFRLTRDSLVSIGDTVVVGSYRLSFGRLLLTTPDGVVTMAPQSVLARPLTGVWIGPLGTEDGSELVLELYPNGVARWRQRPGGAWTTGEWEREFRIISFIWESEEEVEEEEEGEEDEWHAQYDPMGNALLFERTVPESGATILRRVLRGG